jgi:hypothetical protein
MGLTKTQQAIWEKSRAVGTGAQAVVLTDGACAYLVATIALDLALVHRFPEFPADLPGFFAPVDLDSLSVPDVDARALFERLVAIDSDADMYYACLASLHRARLKYEAILETQPIPTLEQVGPRGLLQYGRLTAKSLAGFLFWRKWFFDIDNRAGQETGYLFEPVIANAIGGAPVPAAKSPVKRRRDRRKGRQIDCLLAKRAYEFKIRLTIAASGQGRWREELEYPVDCRASGYIPVLIVLDSTPNPKLDELAKAFRAQRGLVFVGGEAWEHLESLAGATMSRFLDMYVRAPINDLINQVPDPLPDMLATMEAGHIAIKIGRETLYIDRSAVPEPDGDGDDMPEDAGDEVPG